MSDADWDADDFEPAETPATVARRTEAAATDKWEGEDEEEDVKDNWDDDEEEKTEAAEAPDDGTKAVQVKKKRPLKEILAEKEAQQKAEAQRKIDEARKRAEASTPEAIAAAKEAAKKAQEESDYLLAKEAFGVTETKAGDTDSIDNACPSTKEDFDNFKDSLKNKILQFEKSTHYVGFLDDLFREVSLGLEAEDLKKLGSTLSALSNEKIKQQKAAKGKKKKKGVNLTVSRGDGLDDYEAASYDGYDDFI